MSMFLLLANFLAALFAIQLFRGDIDPNKQMNFLHVGNAFLAMYQILSSENWTSILWSTSDSEDPFQQQWIAILLIAGWLFFANCELVFATPIEVQGPWLCSHLASDVHCVDQRGKLRINNN